MEIINSTSEQEITSEQYDLRHRRLEHHEFVARHCLNYAETLRAQGNGGKADEFESRAKESLRFAGIKIEDVSLILIQSK